jgi:hypothetical protein
VQRRRRLPRIEPGVLDPAGAQRLAAPARTGSCAPIRARSEGHGLVLEDLDEVLDELPERLLVAFRHQPRTTRSGSTMTSRVSSRPSIVTRPKP